MEEPLFPLRAGSVAGGALVGMRLPPLAAARAIPAVRDMLSQWLDTSSISKECQEHPRPLFLVRLAGHRAGQRRGRHCRGARGPLTGARMLIRTDYWGGSGLTTGVLRSVAALGRCAAGPPLAAAGREPRAGSHLNPHDFRLPLRAGPMLQLYGCEDVSPLLSRVRASLCAGCGAPADGVKQAPVVAVPPTLLKGIQEPGRPTAPRLRVARDEESGAGMSWSMMTRDAEAERDEATKNLVLLQRALTRTARQMAKSQRQTSARSTYLDDNSAAIPELKKVKEDIWERRRQAGRRNDKAARKSLVDSGSGGRRALDPK
eukprot:SM000574S18615  [mRNA]  locus=s574:1616:2948:+ [translate_table: standard]